MPDAKKDLERIFCKVDEKVKKYGPLSDEEINEIIQQVRKEKRAQG